MRYQFLEPGTTIRGSTDQYFTHSTGWVNTKMHGMAVPRSLPYRRLVCWKSRISKANPAPSLR